MHGTIGNPRYKEYLFSLNHVKKILCIKTSHHWFPRIYFIHGNGRKEPIFPIRDGFYGYDDLKKEYAHYGILLELECENPPMVKQ